jgi:hypothetical protein
LGNNNNFGTKTIDRCSLGSTIICNGRSFNGNELNEIVAIFQKRPKEKPVAIIQNGTPRGKIGLGNDKLN